MTLFGAGYRMENKPLVPVTCDVTSYPFMPVDVNRLLKSDSWLLATPEERSASMCLWLESWQQIPAASLPNDEKLLANFSKAGTRWKKVREHALRGWILCSDNRWYHHVVAEKALEGWIGKLLSSLSGSKGNAERWSITIETKEIESQLQQAIVCLKALSPKSNLLKKKAIKVFEAQFLNVSQDDSEAIAEVSPPDTQGDSSSDRNREGEGEGNIYIYKSDPPEKTDQVDPPDWSPELEVLNTRLRMAGGRAVDQTTLDQTLVLFNPHYEGQYLTPNKRLAKLVSWIRNNQQREGAKATLQAGSGYQTASAQYNPDDDIPECLRDGYQPPPKRVVDQELQQRIKAEQRALADKLAAEVQAKKEQEAAKRAGTP